MKVREDVNKKIKEYTGHDPSRYFYASNDEPNLWKILKLTQTRWATLPDMTEHERKVCRDVYYGLLESVASFAENRILGRLMDFIDVYNIIIKPKLK